MHFFTSNKITIWIGVLFVLIAQLFIFEENWYFFLLPIGLLFIYVALYATKQLISLLFFLTPLSINIEEYVPGFGLFLPTEPLFFGLMILVLAYQFRSKIIPTYLYSNGLVITIGIYLSWLVISALASTHPIVSFKFILAKLWYIVPLFGFGALYFVNTKNIFRFVWMFCIGMLVVIVYTLIHHATFGFGEKEGHWVMWPFFKDHTSYGALTALILPLLIGLYFQKSNSLIVQLVVVVSIIIDLLGIYFSYTRAAWLSVVAAIVVGLLIHFKVKFKYLALGGVFLMIGVGVYWTEIQFLLEKNKYEHTTENFGERLQSATNVTSDASNLERINRWSCAIEMFKERPLFGFGPGTYAFEYARFQEPENLTIISTNFGDMGNAHSEYLGPLSETGLIGLLTFLGVVVLLFYKGITLYISYPLEQDSLRFLILMFVLSLVTYFVHGILNNYLDMDKAAVPVWSMAIIFVVLEEKLKKSATIR
ncbi:MAG: hypothetical protein EB100_00260 [Crocinitomicaceae bacterium]|nr:hypothetical protein [Crocinitomicaceae bacterium]